MFRHQTVLAKEAVDGLNIRPDGIYVDCTMGGAGHSEAIASRLGENGLLIALDQDEEAIRHGSMRLEPYGDRVKIVRSNFRRLRSVVEESGVMSGDGRSGIDGILFDLGVSSPQLDEAERGFSYNREAKLDMRMDREQSFNAMDLVNEWPEREIARILREYGEEKFAGKIARLIVRTRNRQRLETTGQLADLIKEAIPAAARRSGPHPAKRSFQAIRIAVNDELEAFREALEQAIELLGTGGRICVITFHSLEDRICKRILTEKMERCVCPPDFPVCTCGRKPVMKWIHRKPVVPGEQERFENPRARSAKLRVAEKIG